MSILKVSLEDMLRCREQRAAMQRTLIDRHGLPVVCFTMNIPGEIKRTPLIELAFIEGVKRFEAMLPKSKERVFTTSFTGCEAFLVFEQSADKLKSAAVQTEDGAAVGRLYDIDVIDATGYKLSREDGRACLVCGGPAAACARSRAHGLAEILARANALLCDFAATMLAALARDALLVEVNATPKPGLVDQRNTGAHKDMDINSFYLSAASLEAYFESITRCALDAFDVPPENLMEQLRVIGLAAERAMRAATGGANTHKGAIFSMGLLLAGVGICLQTGKPALQEVSRLASSGMADALRAAQISPSTNGERVFARTGALGARGEAACGFPSALAARNALEAFICAGHSIEEAAALTLPLIMEELSDTNLIHRGGEEGLAFARERAAHINALPVRERLAALQKLDDAFIERNLSPGGCADVLSLALLMRNLGEYIVL